MASPTRTSRRTRAATSAPKATHSSAVGDDASGRTGIDFGVYGVPETFVVKGDGTIAFKLIGGVTPGNVALFKAQIAKAAH